MHLQNYRWIDERDDESGWKEVGRENGLRMGEKIEGWTDELHSDYTCIHVYMRRYEGWVDGLIDG